LGNSKHPSSPGDIADTVDTDNMTTIFGTTRNVRVNLYVTDTAKDSGFWQQRLWSVDMTEDYLIKMFCKYS